MKIDQNKCIKCETCIPYCSVGAIIKVDDAVKIDIDECVECNICYHANVCPTSAFIQDPLEDELREFRNTFSDPLKTHKSTNVLGRGTEEMKTNDVTGTFKPGYAGVGIEMGRPNTGTRFYEVEKVARTCAKYDVEFADCNPVTTVMKDKNTGAITEKYLNEKTLSAIIEFTLPLDQLENLLEDLKDVEKEIETVFSIDLISKVVENNKIPARDIVKEKGYEVYPNGKINVGLGKPKYDFKEVN
ncbi:4Fe-4S binding protein [Halanaerobium sp. MA284_MarDTE_T2]|uniref:indolepyruvate ferredoxin oxidoreductase subunit alpha n=1 Tax=Halanaerobium sp. MA284_MarDTE_T2 TaxID=2183913 RepID=UPI000DF1D13E|nr:4Fe-4S binding protein [Halanaerobium sp. MA284_MarDTE_T2]RCW48641.1 4Fe-4S binding protein [Halanaerobium sp. MA284_MarDTE_T2]